METTTLSAPKTKDTPKKVRYDYAIEDGSISGSLYVTKDVAKGIAGFEVTLKPIKA